MYKFLLIILLLSGIGIEIAAQSLVPLHRYRTRDITKLMLNEPRSYHTAMQPFVIRDTSLLFKRTFSRKGQGKNWFMRKLRYENLVMVEKENYRLTIDPVLHFELSKNRDVEELLYRNTRGFMVAGRIGQNVSFQSILYENQVAFQPYVNEMIQTKEIIPHAAKYKPYEIPVGQLSPVGYDYSMAEGVLSWNALPQLNLQFGQGKHFVGDGYRSLLLSDNSYSYPFFKAMLTIGPLQYTSMFAELLDFDLPHGTESGYRKKRYQMHYLSWNTTPWLQVGLFESVVYHAEDSTGYSGFKANYLNPLILSRTAEYGLDTRNNILLGATMKITLPARIQIYGQYVLDATANPSAEQVTAEETRQGYQLGGKWFDALGIQNLYGQMEFNSVSLFTYGHSSAAQNYTHTRQALAHPMGSGFNEFVAILVYSVKDFELEVQGNLARYKTKTAEDISAGSFLMYDQEIIEQDDLSALSLENEFAYGHMQLSYLLNPRTDLRIYAGAALRINQNINRESKDAWVFFGLRTFLSNQLLDF